MAPSASCGARKPILLRRPGGGFISLFRTFTISWIAPSCVPMCFSNSSIRAASSLFAERASRKWTKARTTIDAHQHCLRRVEHRRCHNGAMFGECIRRGASAAVSLSCGCNLQPQVGALAGFQLEHEICGEPLPVAVHLLIETLDRNSVDLSECGVEDDLLMTQNHDAGFDWNHGSSWTYWRKGG